MRRTPIFYRIAIGSAFIIIITAIIGSFLIHVLTDASATIWHFVIFLSVGVVASLILNIIIIQLALRPLRDLRQVVNRIQEGQAAVEQLTVEDTDPDIHQLALALNSLISRLQNSNHQFRLLSERSINVQEEERKRIARSLHDDTGQSLSTLIINLERLEKQIPLDDNELIGRLQKIRQMAADSLACLRSLIYNLRPAILDDLGLLSAIRWYAQSNLEEARINVGLEFPNEFPQLPQSLTTTLFRVLQEGVNNIVRHSEAKNVSISMGVNETEVYLRLQDDGRGFNTDKITIDSPDMQHWGLVGIQERIELVGGRMSITSNPELGTNLLVIAPLMQPEVLADG